MSELDLDRQQIEQIRGDTCVILTEWDEKVKPRLTVIENCAEIVSRNARALPFKPPFTTAAQDELLDAEAALEAALQKVRAAMAEYNSKETA